MKGIFIYSFITACIVTFIIIPPLIKVLNKRQITDAGGRRKIHKGSIPTMGGMAIFIGFVFSLIFWTPTNNAGDFLNLQYTAGAIALIFITGIADDIVDIRAKYKLLVQIVAGMIVAFAGIRLPSFYGVLGIYEIPEWLSYFVTIFTIIVITNAFNLIDGIDGLAGTVGVISLSFLAIWFFNVGDYTIAIVLAGLIGAIAGFLYYNWNPASIFMGDTGSLLIGFILSIATIVFIRENGEMPVGSFNKINAAVGMGIAVVLLPLFDTLRVFILRVRQGHSPFTADKQHLHHIVLRLGYTHAQAALIISGFYLVFLVLTWLLAREVSNTWLIVILVISCGILDFLLNRILKRTYQKRRESDNHKS